MNEDKILNANLIIDRMTKAAGGSSDADLARYLQVSPKTISGWRARNSVPFEHCIETGIKTDISLDALILGKEPKPQNYEQEKPVTNIKKHDSMVAEPKPPTFEENLRRMEQATQRVRLAARSVDNADKLNPSTMSQVLELAYHHNMELSYIKKVLELMISQVADK